MRDESIRSVVVGIESEVIAANNLRPWEFEPPVMAPNMDAGAAILSRASDYAQQAGRFEQNGAGEWTYNKVFKTACELVKWLALYKDRTTDRFAPDDATHPDEKTEETEADGVFRFDLPNELKA